MGDRKSSRYYRAILPRKILEMKIFNGIVREFLVFDTSLKVCLF